MVYGPASFSVSVRPAASIAFANVVKCVAAFVVSMTFIVGAGGLLASFVGNGSCANTAIAVTAVIIATKRKLRFLQFIFIVPLLPENVRPCSGLNLNSVLLAENTVKGSSLFH